MGKYEQPPGEGEQKEGEKKKKERQQQRAGRGREAEMRRDEETDNKWDDAPHDGLPQAFAATWNYTTKDRSVGGGGGGGGVVH